MTEQWVEGVVTSVFNGRVFITFKQGSTICHNVTLSLGDVVDIRVKATRDVDRFDIVEMGNDVRKRNDLTIEPFETTKCTVYCTAEVIERCGKGRVGYFLLDTPIIGVAVFPIKDAPRDMKVGDVRKVKMLRRKDKKGTPSFWWIMEVEGKLSSELSRRKEIEENERIDRETVDQSNTSGYSSLDSLPSSPNTSQDDWTTVIITGSDNLFWFASCARTDVIRIPKKQFNRYGNIVNGSFYRVKFSIERNGDAKVNDIERDPVYPRNIEVDTTKNILQLWCYSTIVEERQSSFIVHNSLIGNAILPLNNVTSTMRMGDRLETLYRREKTFDNGINWMVIDAAFDRSKKEYEYKKEEEAIQIVDEFKGVKSLNEEKVTNDGRVLATMRHMMSFTIVRGTFVKEDPKTMKIIERILNKV